MAEHYRDLSTEELLDSVLTRYREVVWPLAAARIRKRAVNGHGHSMALEGSALRRERVAEIKFAEVAAVWFTADGGR